MHARTSVLSYIPMTNLYIAVKLAFGKKVAWIFYILCIISLIIVYNTSSMTFACCLAGLVILATLIDIVKLVSGKYDLFVIGKKKNDDSLDDVFSTSSGSRFIDEGVEQNSNNESPVTANDFLNSIDNGINDKPKTEGPLVDSNDVVDISYDSDVPISDENGFDLNDSLSSKNDDDLLDEENTIVPETNALTPVSNVVSKPASHSNEDNNTSSIPKLGEEKSGESELSNFFR